MRRLFNNTITLYLLLFMIYLGLRLTLGDGLWWLSLLNTFAHFWFLPLALFIPLALLIRQRQALLRLLPVIAVGGLWFVPYYLPAQSSTEDGLILTVLNANVWGHNHDLSQIENWVREVDADVVTLQEISPAYATDSLPRLRDHYLYQVTQADDTRFGGNILLSRYPIIEQMPVDLKTPGHPAPVRAVLDINGQRIAVYNLHLAWPSERHLRVKLPSQFSTVYTQMLVGFDDRTRNQQIVNLLAVLGTEPYPFILGGDFNTSDQSVTYQLLAQQMTDAFRASGEGFQGSWPVSAARGLPAFVPPLLRLDYIWHSPQFQTIHAQMGPKIGSDHLPVRATLLLPASIQK